MPIRYGQTMTIDLLSERPTTVPDGTACHVLENHTSYRFTNGAWGDVSGGGAVASVNGQTGTVVLDKTHIGLANVPNIDATVRSSHTGPQSADTLTDGTTNKAFLATERTKLAGIATGATANATDAQLRDRALMTGTQLASTISDFAETARDTIAAALVAGANVTITPNDPGDTITIAATGGGGLPEARFVLPNGVTSTSTSAADITGMNFAVAANEVWHFDIHLFVGCSGTGGVKFTITIPSGSFRASAFGTLASMTAFTSADMTVSGTLTTAFVTANLATGWVQIRGAVSNGATPGNVQVRFAAGTNGQTASIFTRSKLHAWRVS